MHLAGRFVVDLESLLFHLKKKLGRAVTEAWIVGKCRKKEVEEFLSALGDREPPERDYALLGQLVLSQMYSLQTGKLLLLCRRGYFPVRDDFRAAWKLVRAFQLPESSI